MIVNSMWCTTRLYFRLIVLCQNVNVTVSYAHPDILIRITDNGRGFDTKKRLAALTSEKRMGLRSMEERAKLLGGEMTLRSQAMKGTGIHIRLPYGEKLSE